MDFDDIPQSKEECKNNETNSNFDENISSNVSLFCLDCYEIPEYKIEIGTDNSISLIHKCAKVDKIISFKSEIKLISFAYNNVNKCIYCKKEYNDICIECKQNICYECGQSHIPVEKPEDNPFYLFEDEDTKMKRKRYIWPINDLQFICKSHYLQYEYFCPICRKNLCETCKNYHFHINCPSLNEFKIKIESENETDIKLKNEVVMKNMKKISQAFENCYKEAKQSKKMSFNILMNYSLKELIYTFFKNYKDKEIKRKEIISNNILDKEKSDNYLCTYFYDKTFKKYYSNLIDSINNGDYESHFKMEVIKRLYKEINRLKKNYYFDENSFYSSLKAIIEYFRGQYHYIKEMISSINMKINNNYFKKEIENLNLLIKIHDLDIKLLKKVNMNLLFKYDYELRRKIGNLMAELIISNYFDLLDPIKENDYILYESLLLIKKKFAQIEQLEGPEDVLSQYENEMKAHFTNLLTKVNNQIKKDKDIIKINKDKSVFEENETIIQFHQSNNENNNILEAILINLFFRLRKCFGIIFNESIHNKTENVNSQIKEEIEKLGTLHKGNINKNIEITTKEKEENNLVSYNDKNNIGICDSYFEGINKIKTILMFDDNIMKEKNKNILNIFESSKSDEYIESDIKEFQSQISKIFKEYGFKEKTNFKDASNLLFKGEIIDILSEKKTYENFNLLKKEMEKLDLEKAKEEVLKDFNSIQPLIDEYLTTIESMKIKALSYIKQFENFIFEGKNKRNGKLNKNPFITLDKYINVFLYEIRSQEEIKKIYMSYLINFYFCADDTLNYLQEIKSKYKDIEMIDVLIKNIEKEKLLEVFNSKIQMKDDNYLKEEWEKLQKEEEFIENNSFLNEKIKDYVKNKNEDQFLKDLSNIGKIKEKVIDLSKPDPQKLLIQAYWKNAGIPWNYPKELKLKKVQP